MEERSPIWTVAANILNEQSRTADKGWSHSLGLGEVLTTPHLKTGFATKHKHLPRTGLIFWYDLSKDKGT